MIQHNVYSLASFLPNIVGITKTFFLLSVFVCLFCFSEYYS